MTNLFYSEAKELRSGWKILRVFIFTFTFMLLFPLILSLLKVDALGDYSGHFAIIAGVLVELWVSRKPLSYIGLNIKDKDLWKDMLVGVVWGCLSIGLVAAGMVLVSGEIRLNQIGRGFTVSYLAPLLFHWSVVSVAEESLFRGYVLSVLDGRLDKRAILIVSADIFAAIHLGNPEYYWFAFIYAFLLGILFGVVVIKRGNLGGVIGFHLAWNLFQDKTLLSMPDRGGETVYTVILLLNIGLVYWLLHRQSISEGK